MASDKTCQCDNGQAAEGDDCSSNGANECASCSAGFHLDGNNCVANVCSCSNGVPAENTACTTHNTNICASCTGAFHLADGSCVANECVCSNGAAASGAACTTNGQNICASCNTGYRLDSGSCVANVCVCENGTPGEGESCEVHGSTVCSECDENYDLDNGFCKDSSQCFCENGQIPTRRVLSHVLDVTRDFSFLHEAPGLAETRGLEAIGPAASVTTNSSGRTAQRRLVDADNSCDYVFDGFCDEPDEYCLPHTDCSDCVAAGHYTASCCVDSPDFRDAVGDESCAEWAAWWEDPDNGNCDTVYTGYEDEMANIRNACPVACGECVRERIVSLIASPT